MQSGRSLSQDVARAAGLALVCALMLAWVSPGVAPVLAHGATTQRAEFTRPAENAAYARIATVRVLTSYYGSTGAGNLIPAINQCAGTGALVGTTGAGLNSYTYVLLPTALVNPLNPCQGVQSTFTQFNGAASSWGIIKIQVMMDAAYTGSSTQQLGSITYTIDPSQIRTTGANSGPKLLALPLTVPSGAPAHDLPVLQTPQASDAPPDPSAATFIDLTGYDAQALDRDSLLKADVPTTLYPVAFPAGQVFTQKLAPTATAGPAPTGTAAPTATVAPKPTALAAQLSLGAIEVDGNGRLIGMVGPDDQGNHVFYDVNAINAAIGSVNGKPGSLMSEWQKGLTSFYAPTPDFGQAHNAFTGLLATYPDFAGAQPFADAANQQTGDIPSLTGSTGQTAPRTTPGTGQGNGLSMRALTLMAGGGLLAALLLAGASFAVIRMRRGRIAPAARLAPADEAMLDLLPPDMALEDVVEQPTRPLASVKAGPTAATAGAAPPTMTANASRPPAIDEIATSYISIAPRATAAPRRASVLAPRSAGLTDPGVKRADDPNQDNVFSLEGIRQEGGRMQPFGLFIVADGMGGHLNGQLASRLAIETMARTVVRALTPVQQLDATAAREMLVESVRAAHLEIQRRNRENAGDMGSTVTAALVMDDRAFVINVGDSRTYVLSPDAGLMQITRDHSIVASLAASGVIKPEDIYIHPRRNQIYRSLGGEEENLDVDAFEQELQAGDKLLLCSDGLWEMVRDPQIAHILRGAADPDQAVHLLVREANANGGEDNIGVVVARMIEGLPSGAEPGMRMIAGPSDAEHLAGG